MAVTAVQTMFLLDFIRRSRLNTPLGTMFGAAATAPVTRQAAKAFPFKFLLSVCALAAPTAGRAKMPDFDILCASQKGAKQSLSFMLVPLQGIGGVTLQAEQGPPSDFPVSSVHLRLRSP